MGATLLENQIFLACGAQPDRYTSAQQSSKLESDGTKLTLLI